ncbi:hypothetical protein WK59_03730 [Burkholderia ubonensis]|nr:hypothetical protein WK59_03730 [Burkholderia ubonensis]
MAIEGNMVEIVIHRSSAAHPLDATTLADELRSVGFVVFVSGRLWQRAVTEKILTLVRPELAVMHGEAGHPNFCMCIVDTARYDYGSIRKAVERADAEYEAAEQQNGG